MKSKFPKPCHIYRFYKFSPVPPSLLKNMEIVLEKNMVKGYSLSVLWELS
ncbi:MAG: hypothetical protein VYA44_09315 [SAR324 cluster bacterium]|nr:hypothetical protein [SAR324 cluster bacterium]MEC7888040.1 hypothetical protein [SAR324 cluster bacterium]